MVGEKSKRIKETEDFESVASDTGVNPEGWRDIKLTSVKLLRETVKQRCHSGIFSFNVKFLAGGGGGGNDFKNLKKK